MAKVNSSGKNAMFKFNIKYWFAILSQILLADDYMQGWKIVLNLMGACPYLK